jgi:acyl-coenzyme A synthetase/AMP-(fatty) acid ligase
MSGVENVCVIGVPDLHNNNLIVAAIVRKENEKLSQEEVVEFVRRKNPSYKHLDGGVYFFDKLPMTPSGKIIKRIVKEKIIKLREL